MPDIANLQPDQLPIITTIDGATWIMVCPPGGDPSKITTDNARPYLKGDQGIQGPPGTNGTNGSNGLGLAGIYTLASPVNNSSNTSLSNITGLAHTCTNGVPIAVTASILFLTAATTTGIAFAWTGPTMAANGCGWDVTIPQGAAGTDQMRTASAQALATILNSTAVVAANTVYRATIMGVFVPSANGVVQLQFRSMVNGSQVTVLAGSKMAVN